MWEYVLWIVVFPSIMLVVSYAAAEWMERWIARTEERVLVPICADPNCSACARNRKGQDAEKKAKALFYSLLTPEQLKEAKTKGMVTEIGGKTGRTYVISLQTLVSNISMRDTKTGHQIARLCIYMMNPPGGGVPPTDHFIAQLMYVRHNEASLLRRAVVSRY